jgi:hypothetical protein
MKTLGLFITAIWILIFPIANAQNIELVGSCTFPGWAFHVFELGNFIYVADYANGLLVIDVSNPTNPFLAGNYNTPEQAYGVEVRGEYAYVTIGNSGLQVIDILDPYNPTLVGAAIRQDIPLILLSLKITHLLMM